MLVLTCLLYTSYLGEGVSFTDRGAVKRDLEIMICAGVKENIPVVIGTAGGSGAKPHLEWCADIIREIAKEHDLHFKMAMIHADMDKEEMKKALTEGKISPQEPAPQLTVEDIDCLLYTSIPQIFSISMNFVFFLVVL